MNTTCKTILIIILIPLLAGCSFERKYDISRKYNTSQIDTLTVNMVTYIGRKPVTADWQSRHDPTHRRYYINHSKDFRIAYYHIAKDSTHYYYIIRPARTVSGNTRGVGGSFRLEDGNLNIVEFIEEFNTPAMDEESLLAMGRELFKELISVGNVDRFLRRSDYIEWPDARLKYDRSRNEWRYDID